MTSVNGTGEVATPVKLWQRVDSVPLGRAANGLQLRPAAPVKQTPSWRTCQVVHVLFCGAAEGFDLPQQCRALASLGRRRRLRRALRHRLRLRCPAAAAQARTRISSCVYQGAAREH